MPNDNPEGSVELRFDKGLAYVTLCRPARLNALAGSMREQLSAGIAEAAARPEIGPLIITGAGKGFCAGGDLDRMADLRSHDNEAGFRQLLHAGADVVLALQAFPGLTVAAVNGVAAGAGLGLALGCDIRIASREASFTASWSRIGLAPDWGASHWLPRLLGYARALDLTLSARRVDADEARGIGLVHEVVKAEDLLGRATEIALAYGAPRDTVRETKRLLRKGLTGSLEASLAAETEAQEDLFVSDDLAEGLRAFRERRAPRFGVTTDDAGATT